ncbi:hypothetical protein P6F26_09490 [Roseibacterium sp. SDUM158017]|nr:hypothetical protein [Roseibacterium sp. SDUM158017]MDG4648680.1 hypothetical protein [Roseibacterium sp. SDUM158017]
MGLPLECHWLTGDLVPVPRDDAVDAEDLAAAFGARATLLHTAEI